jgi:hypothetical protein
VQAVLLRQPDRSLHKRRANPAAPPVTVGVHINLAEAMAGDLQVEHPDNLTVGLRHDQTVDGAGELSGPRIDVDRRLGRDPVTLLGHCREQLRQRRRIVHRGCPHRELGHRPILSLLAASLRCSSSWWSRTSARDRTQVLDASRGRDGQAGPGRAEANGHAAGTRHEEALMMATKMISENMALAARFQVERMTGIEPAMSAWESTDFVRIIHLEQHITPTLSSRDRPLITASNGLLIARHRRPKSGCNTLGSDNHPSVLEPLFALGHGDRELERAGTLGTPAPGPCPRSSSASAPVGRGSGTPGTAGTLFLYRASL